MTVKEPTSKHLHGLEAITKDLIDDASFGAEVTEQDVQQRLHEPDKFTADEIKVAVGIVNSFRPFSPKRDADHPIPQNILAIGPICQLFNMILWATGYGDFTRKLCPVSSCGKLQPIPLGATGICEALCAKDPRHFDVLDSKNWI